MLLAAKALVSFDPAHLQTAKVLPTAAMKKAIPLVDEAEWERYIVLPPQQPPPKSTAGRVQWWKQRLSEFPKLAPIAIAYLLTPRSAAQAERSFSLLGHVWD